MIMKGRSIQHSVWAGIQACTDEMGMEALGEEPDRLSDAFNSIKVSREL